MARIWLGLVAVKRTAFILVGVGVVSGIVRVTVASTVFEGGGDAVKVLVALPGCRIPVEVKVLVACVAVGIVTFVLTLQPVVAKRKLQTRIQLEQL